MRKLILVCSLVLLGSTSVLATTYLKLWVNGNAADSLQQGDFFAWEYDISQQGGESTFQIYLDLNSNQELDESDVLVEQFTQQDGDVGSEGPGDSSAVLDGLVYTDLGPFGLAPGDYILKVIDIANESDAYAAMHISAMLNPSAKITGNLFIEGITAPDERLAGIQIGAEAIQSFQGFWSGSTDQNGYYEINLPDSAIGSEWEVSFFFELQTSAYIESEDIFLVVDAGINPDVDFYLSLPTAFVYGYVVDDSGQALDINGYGSLVRFNEWDGNDFNIINGHFSASAFIPQEIDGDWFYLAISEEGLNPDYLRPSNDNENPDTVYVAHGDSIKKDIMVYKADSSIVILITKENKSPGESFMFHAYSDSFGSNQTMSDTSGFAKIKVKSGAGYSIGLLDNPEYGTPLPDGYIIEDSPWQWVNAGDTAYFNLIPAGAVLAGKLSFDPDDPLMPYNSHDFQVEIYDSNWTQFYQASVNEGLEYWQPVKDGVFEVRFDDWSNDFLAKPAWYAHVYVDSDTTDTLDFELNYRNAEIYVRLKHAPDEAFWEGFYIHTLGEFPNVYQVEGWPEDDSTFVFNVCDGDWYIEAPNFSKDELDTVLTVSNLDSTHFIEFDYDPVLAIEDDNAKIPKEFFVKQNYPNPFNPQTTIEFGLPFRNHVKVEIFDITGKLVESLFNGELNAGVHYYTWNAENFASGLYFYRINTGKQEIMNKLILLK
ncbi:MAG: T9SS C-terminal target domain-containing protein [Calditrichaeota bacterium]|nr:MAG: T9SS C-terminal target domain-containing protein [Calditrichota bacterium]MBL1207605.1 T9SS C-terminal target domain-containing protein [Calditrichota bacterium]NOG47438.1 T9SS type A sorting domain-containing protein [Calditrichota bacterium]